MEERKNLRFAGVWTPRPIWLLPNMSYTEKVLLAEIESLDRTQLGCFASNEYFAMFFQLGVRQIKRYIARLAALRWIEVVMTRGNWRQLRATTKLQESMSGR